MKYKDNLDKYDYPNYDLFIILEYNTGHSTREIGRKLNLDYRIINHRLKVNKVKIRTKSEIFKFKKLVIESLKDTIIEKPSEIKCKGKFNDTSIELKFEEYLITRNIKYLKQVKFSNFSHYYDFYLNEIDLLVEVDSYAFHGYNKTFTDELNEKFKLKDKIIDLVTLKLNKKLLRITESDLNDFKLIDYVFNNLNQFLVKLPELNSMYYFRTLNLLNSDKAFSVINVLEFKFDTYCYYKENHWKYNSNLKYSEILDYACNNKVTVNDLYYKFNMSRNLLKRICDEAGTTIIDFCAKYTAPLSKEWNSLELKRLDYTDSNEAIRPYFTRSYLAKILLNINRTSDLYKELGRSRNKCIHLYMIAFNLDFNTVIDLFHGDNNETKIKNISSISKYL